LDKTECIDDAEVYARYIGPVHTVEGERNNLKITYPDDFTTAAKAAGPELEGTDPHNSRLSETKGAL
jgi:2-C-methyl-D-erythritol 4-phosphate cytidylyltransferase